MVRIALVLGFALLFTGCGDDAPSNGGNDGNGGNHGGSPAPPPPIDFTGQYNTTGTWDLSGPIAASESIGQGVARIVVDGLVQRSGAPSLIEDEVQGALDAALLDPIAAAVDAQTPPEWRVGGELHTVLTMKLAGIEADTLLTLDGEGDALDGTERVTALRVPGATVFSVDLTALDEDGTGIVTLESPVTAAVSGLTLDIDDHVFVIRLDRVITQIIDEQMGVDLGPLTALLTGNIDCQAVLETIGAADGLTFSVAGRDIGFDADTVNDLCEAAVGPLTDRAVGVFSRDTGIELGGPVTGVDANGDGLIDTLTSGADYGGQFTSLPIPLDATVTASFSATR